MLTSDDMLVQAYFECKIHGNVGVLTSRQQLRILNLHDVILELSQAVKVNDQVLEIRLTSFKLILLAE